MLFFVKVRIDTSKLHELAEKLESGELDKNNLITTFCVQSDPSVGLNIWEADNKKSFDRIFEPHKKYYKEIFEITPVVTPEQAKDLLMKGM